MSMFHDIAENLPRVCPKKLHLDPPHENFTSYSSSDPKTFVNVVEIFPSYPQQGKRIAIDVGCEGAGCKTKLLQLNNRRSVGLMGQYIPIKSLGSRY